MSKVETTETIIKNYREARKEIKKLKSQLGNIKCAASSMKYMIDRIANYKIDQYDDYLDAYCDLKSLAEDCNARVKRMEEQWNIKI